MPTPAECFSALDTELKGDRKRTASLDATYQFVLSGEHGGEWWIKAASGTGETGEGRIDNPTATVITTDETFVGLATGEIEGQDALFTGRLKVEGDAPMAMYLRQIFGH
jgi:putative sterol carrier protein